MKLLQVIQPNFYMEIGLKAKNYTQVKNFKINIFTDRHQQNYKNTKTELLQQQRKSS